MRIKTATRNELCKEKVIRVSIEDKKNKSNKIKYLEHKTLSTSSNSASSSLYFNLL